jgi:16S rRNA processing protein RimM
MTSAQARICLGVIVGAKGIGGEVRIKSFTEDPVDVGSYGPVSSEDGTQSWTLKVVGQAKGTVTARITGVTDRNQAEALRGIKLFVHRSRLPELENAYYHADLIGLDVVLTNGEAKGKIVAVHNFGGGDIIEVGDGTNETVMVPFSGEAIAEVNMKDGFVRVEPLPGVFGGGDEEEGQEEKGV